MYNHPGMGQFITSPHTSFVQNNTQVLSQQRNVYAVMVDNNDIIQMSSEGQIKIGVIVSKYKELEDKHNEVIGIAKEYYQEIIKEQTCPHCGGTVPPLYTPEPTAEEREKKRVDELSDIKNMLLGIQNRLISLESKTIPLEGGNSHEYSEQDNVVSPSDYRDVGNETGDERYFTVSSPASSEGVPSSKQAGSEQGGVKEDDRRFEKKAKPRFKNSKRTK